MHDATQGNILRAEIPYCPPLNLFESFHDQTGAILLHSAIAHESCGQFSYIAIEPFKTLIAKNGTIKVDGQSLPGNPFLALKTLLADYKQPTQADLPPFKVA